MVLSLQEIFFFFSNCLLSIFLLIIFYEVISMANEMIEYSINIYLNLKLSQNATDSNCIIESNPQCLINCTLHHFHLFKQNYNHRTLTIVPPFGNNPTFVGVKV